MVYWAMIRNFEAEKNSVGKPEEKNPLRRPRHRKQDTMK
jgi:hypothetical protein